MPPEIELKREKIEALIATFLKRAEANYNAVFEVILKQMAKLKVKDGKIDEPLTKKEARARANRIVAVGFADSDYDNIVFNLLRELPSLTPFDVKIQKAINGISDLDKLTKAKREIVDEISKELFSPLNFSAKVINPIQQELATAIIQGKSVLETEAALQLKIANKGFTGYAAHQSVYEYDGAVQQKIADVYELDALLYVGTLIKTSRPQCRKWETQGTIKIENLQSEIDWAKANGSGMIPTTTPENFLRYRGGYRCRHQAIPIRS